MSRERLTDDALASLVRKACGAPSVGFGFPPTPLADDARAMRTLGRVLTADATPAVAPSRLPRSPRILTAAVSALVAVAVAVALAVAFLDASTPALAQRFPVFASPASRPVSAALSVFREAGVDVGTARALPTPHGTAYVIASPHASRLCVAAPAILGAELRSLVTRERNRSAAPFHVKYVGGCAPTARVEHRGLVLSIPARRGHSELIVLLPAGASTPVLHLPSGASRKLDLHRGSAATVLTTPATLEYEIRGANVITTVRSSVTKPYALNAPTER